ncbi:MAG: hypothetical protein KatS3mg002_0248 [Candidatus Woesearchaeota archaeon]|nr:MAG: hypothetical protein KatS3mg002_0248 [Candidatus Woesearchaeota archaeon]
MITYSFDELWSLTVPELYDLCKSYGIPGMRKARKSTMINAIMNYYESNSNDASDINNNHNQSEEEEDSMLNGVRATVNAIRNEDNTVSAMVRVSCGANRDTFPVVGKTIRDVITLLTPILNIPAGAEAYVNGQSESYSYILKEGDTLEFIRPAGSKG